MRKSRSKSKVEGPTRAQITARDHSGLSTFQLNLRISTMMTEQKNLSAESEEAARTIKDNAPRIANLKTDIAALESLVERRR